MPFASIPRGCEKRGLSAGRQIEKVIVGGTYATIRLRPLAPERYPFMGEFHPDTAQGVVISE
jgi:hypothetical protein